jgi:hypothetical protein
MQGLKGLISLTLTNADLSHCGIPTTTQYIRFNLSLSLWSALLRNMSLLEQVELTAFNSRWRE